MNIYHETTLERLENPDLTLGRTYPARRFVAHHDAVAEVSHLEELAAMHPPDPQPTPGPDTAATWDELAAAYTEGVNT